VRQDRSGTNCFLLGGNTGTSTTANGTGQNSQNNEDADKSIKKMSRWRLAQKQKLRRY
jgi:hypothetical protein